MALSPCNSSNLEQLVLNELSRYACLVEPIAYSGVAKHMAHYSTEHFVSSQVVVMTTASRDGPNVRL